MNELRPKPWTPDEAIEMERRYLAASEPYAALKTEILARAMPTYVVSIGSLHGLGPLRVEYRFTDLQRELIGNIDAIMDLIRDGVYGGSA